MGHNLLISCGSRLLAPEVSATMGNIELSLKLPDWQFIKENEERVKGVLGFKTLIKVEKTNYRKLLAFTTLVIFSHVHNYQFVF